MAYTKSVNMDKWLDARKVALKKTPPGKRPRSKERPIKSRTDAERRALALSCKQAWETALKTGYYKKTENGYSIC